MFMRCSLASKYISLICIYMADNYLADIKNVSIRDLEIFELFLKSNNIESISEKLQIDPNKVTINLQGIIKKFTATVERINPEKKEKILTVSNSDVQSFKSSEKILYRLKIIRKIYNLTMEQVAEKIGIERQTYSKIENSEIDLNTKHINRITDFFVSTFKDRLAKFNIDFEDDTSLYDLGEFNQENINKMLWYNNFLQPLTDFKRKALLKVVDKDREDTLAQLMLYAEVVNYIYYIIQQKEELFKKVKDKRLISDKELPQINKDKKKLRILNNEILYAVDLRNFIFSNLQQNKFVDYRNYYFELLFIPRVILNKAILEKITNLIQELKK